MWSLAARRSSLHPRLEHWAAWPSRARPAVLLVIGVNGVGQDHHDRQAGQPALSRRAPRSCWWRADTFRAAAVLQLEVWGKRVGCPVVKGKENADPASVVFDALKRAEIEGADPVIVDTAGRLHTEGPVDGRAEEARTHRGEGTGSPRRRDLARARFDQRPERTPASGAFPRSITSYRIVLTKLDGTAKGGVVLGIVDEQQLANPVHWHRRAGARILREFDPQSFVEALFERPDSETSAA